MRAARQKSSKVTTPTSTRFRRDFVEERFDMWTPARVGRELVRQRTMVFASIGRGRGALMVPRTNSMCDLAKVDIAWRAMSLIRFRAHALFEAAPPNVHERDGTNQLKIAARL